METVYTENRDALVIPPGDGRTTWVAGHPITHKVTGEHTGGSFSFFESSVPPGNGAPRHIHHAADETCYILDGTFEFRIGNRVFTGRPGLCLHIPRGVIHGFRNCGTTWGRILTIASPSGMENVYRDLSNVSLEEPGGSAELKSLCEKHQMEILPEPDEDLVFA